MAIKKQKNKKECEINSESAIKYLKKILNALTNRYIVISGPKTKDVRISLLLLAIALIVAPWFMIPVILIGGILGIALGYSFIIEKNNK